MSEGLQIVISADVQDLTKGLNTATKATQDFAQSAKKLATSATPALNSLGMVARDLPFGFIAIQNNLPIVFDQFGALVKESGSLGGALKSLGSTLAGPAGVTFAIGAIIAGITALVQKYGSLSNAIKVFTSDNAEATKTQLEYNKEIAKNQGSVNVQIRNLQQLSATFNDASKGANAQLAAFIQLKKIQPDIATGISQENALTQNSINLINQRTQSYINFLKVQARSNAITSVTSKNEEQIVLKEQELAIAAQEYNDALKIQQKYKDVKKDNFQAQQEAILLDTRKQKALSLAAEIKNLVEVNSAYFKQLDDLTQQTAVYNKTQVDAADAAKKEADRQKELADQLKRIAELKAMTPLKGTLQTVETDNSAIKNYIDNLSIIPKKLQDKKITQGVQVYPSEKVIQDKANLEYIFTQSQTYFKLLTPLIDNVFSAIENGQNAFKALGQSIKQFVVDIVKALIKTAALAAIISLVSAAFGSPIPFGESFKLVNSAQGGLLGAMGRSAAPSIGGAGGLQGGMQLAGNVVFVQRGYDLVGVLNASNGSINNVG